MLSQAFLRFAAHAARQHPRTIVAIAALFAILSGGLAAWKLELNADTDDLIGKNRPYRQTYGDFLEEFGDLEFLYVVVANEGDSIADTAKVEHCVDTLVERLRKIPERYVPGVHGYVEPDEQFRVATRAMDDETLADFASVAGALPVLVEDGKQSEHASGPLIRANQLLRRLTNVTGALMSRETQERLGAEALFLLHTVASFRSPASERTLGRLATHEPKREYFKSPTGRLYFIHLMPLKNYGTMAVIEEPLRRIRAVLDDVRSEFPDLEIGLTGKPVLQADEMTTTDRDMTIGSIMAIALVAVLFMVMLGGVVRPLLAVASLVTGIAWTFGLTTLVIGQLNLLSVVFALILVGIGIDFGVHLLARYREESRTKSVDDAMEAALLHAGRGNVTGALTSSMAFLMALFTDFQGLRELGFIAGSGLLLCLVAMTFLLPSLVLLRDRKHGGPKHPKPNDEPTSPAIQDRIWRTVVAHPGKVLVGAVILTVGLVGVSHSIRFEENLLELQARGVESVEWEHRIIDDYGAGTWFGAVIADDLDEVNAVIERARKTARIGDVHSVFDIVARPTPRRAELRASIRERLEEASPISVEATPNWNGSLLTTSSRLLDRLARRAAGDAPEEAAAMTALATSLRALGNEVRQADDAREIAVRNDADAHVRRLAKTLRLAVEGDRLPLREALPSGVRDTFVSPNGRYLVMLHPVENVWNWSAMDRFVAAIRDIDPDVTGVPITHYESIRDMKNGFGKAIGLALLAVTILLFIDFRSPLKVVLALVPLILGSAWLIGGMGLLGTNFNLANFFSVPILIGIGVDNGVHILHRWLEGGPNRHDLGSTRRGVTLTSLTTLVGFGCLATATHRGLRSFGLVMAGGSLACLVTSLFVLPPLLIWLERRRDKRFAEPTDDSTD